MKTSKQIKEPYCPPQAKTLGVETQGTIAATSWTTGTMEDSFNELGEY